MSIKQIKRWNDLHALIVLFTGALALWLRQLDVLCLTALFSFLYYIYDHRQHLKRLSPPGGYANWVTTFRLFLLLTIGLTYPQMNSQWISPLLLLIVLLDVADGYLARKMNQQSDFGLYFDMETDAFFVALVCSMLYLMGLAPAWILAVGYMRFINVALYQLLQLKPRKESKQRFASTIAGTLFVVLALSFVLPSVIRYYSLLIVSILVLLSFVVSFWNYFK